MKRDVIVIELLVQARAGLLSSCSANSIPQIWGRANCILKQIARL